MACLQMIKWSTLSLKFLNPFLCAGEGCLKIEMTKVTENLNWSIHLSALNDSYTASRLRWPYFYHRMAFDMYTWSSKPEVHMWYIRDYLSIKKNGWNSTTANNRHKHSSIVLMFYPWCWTVQSFVVYINCSKYYQ